jgi:flagellar hook assembly protein FlgD
MNPAPPGDGRDRARRGVVAAAMLALFVIALGIFLLPFAFPTPPPIVTRFQATQLFSPNGDGRRDVARVNVRLHEPSRVTIEIQKDGEPIVTLVDDERRPKGFRSTEWFGRDRFGRLLPDGTYAIKLAARAGEKQFNKPRNIVIDTTAPRIGELSVTSATLAGAGRGECRVALTAADPGSVVLQARPAGGGDPVRRLGARPVRGDATIRWQWNGTDAGGRDVPPGLYVIDATLSDAARNRDEQVATCWVGRMAGTAVPSNPRPRDRVRVRLRGTADVLRAATAATFDRIDSDGCQSTNDTVVLLASGASGVTVSPFASTTSAPSRSSRSVRPIPIRAGCRAGGGMRILAASSRRSLRASRVVERGWDAHRERSRSRSPSRSSPAARSSRSRTCGRPRALRRPARARLPRPRRRPAGRACSRCTSSTWGRAMRSSSSRRAARRSSWTRARATRAAR